MVLARPLLRSEESAAAHQIDVSTNKLIGPARFSGFFPVENERPHRPSHPFLWQYRSLPSFPDQRSALHLRFFEFQRDRARQDDESIRRERRQDHWPAGGRAVAFPDRA